MGDGMTKKHHLLLYSLLGVCLVIAVGFAIAAQRGKRQYARALEDAYRGTLLSSMTQMEQLRLNIDKAMLSQDEGQSAALISRIGSDAAAVQSGLSALPLSHIAMADAVKLCNQLSDYAAALLSQADAALTAEDAQVLEQLSHACAQLQQALQSAYGQMQTGRTAIAQFNRYMQDADAAARPLEGVSKDIDYPTLIYDGPFSDVVSGGAPRGLGAQAVDSAQALACAQDFLGDCGQDVALTQESGGTIPAWGVRAQGAAGVLQLAVTKQGGNVLWMFPESAQYEPSYGLEDCKQAAQAFFSAHCSMVKDSLPKMTGICGKSFAASACNEKDERPLLMVARRSSSTERVMTSSGRMRTMERRRCALMTQEPGITISVREEHSAKA